ncbi:C40 family peptidase [Curtobacterium ammoniigenes]|uniref:C40 family peptidase n=1 Tax=Curtobacterium ammoniigenes TaxID=395387 RepID=UPI0008370245|nr:C40 family peptidase [Curtobacterium ammoniigenes]
MTTPPTLSSTDGVPTTRRARREAEALAAKNARRGMFHRGTGDQARPAVPTSANTVAPQSPNVVASAPAGTAAESAPVAPASAAATPAPAAAAPALATPAAATPAAPAPAAHAPVARAAASAPTRPTPAPSSLSRNNPTTGPITRAGFAALGSAAVAAPAKPARRTGGMRRKVLPAVVVTLTAGIFGSMTLPAFAAPSDATKLSAAAQNLTTPASQSLTVSDVAAISDTNRDGYTTTLPAPKVVAKPAAASVASAASIEQARAATAATYAAYSGPTAAQLAAAPKYPSFSLAQVVAVAKQYIGTPYVFGGATPAGFDCSGYVMYVYAQFGIKLQHSVPLQDAVGTTIPVSQAQPGDVVIFDNEGHEGFYMGNGEIMDAPSPGGRVSIRPIWNQPYHIVRFGI